MDDGTDDILAEIAAYYSARLAEHGPTARGADWNSEEGQQLRFAQLAKLIVPPLGFSLNDVGCGYAAMFDYLDGNCRDFSYFGIDVSASMIATARARIGSRSNVRLNVAGMPPTVADYSIASGIFNVRGQRGDADWSGYLETMLAAFDRCSRRGFAFNCLTAYADAEKKRPDLYYADPCAVFDLCKRSFSRDVALLHDYGLYEFTILVRKTT